MLAVLYVDDEPGNLELFELQLGEVFKVRTAASGAEALKLLHSEDIGVLLSDERMPQMSGADLLAAVYARWPDVVRVIVSAYSDTERLLRAINRGHAHEYIVKPWDAAELRECIERGLAVAERRRRLTSSAQRADVLKDDLRAVHGPQRLVGTSPGFLESVAAARRAAANDANVLLRGETGTGKDVIAWLIHDASPRAGGPFVRVNCAALAEGLLESELFGHEQGAFTGAAKMRKGRFELADAGTIFLDEIGDVSAKLQVALLRVLQEHEIERVGGNVTLEVDVRVIAATHRNLEERLRQGTFREDLYYRLNVVSVTVPPLRERRDDIPALIDHFIARHATARGVQPRVSAEALAALCRYGWPGNVRELENLVQRALALADGEELTLEDFSLRLAPARTLRQRAREVEAEELERLLLEHGGNCARAARALGIPRTTLLSRAKKHRLL